MRLAGHVARLGKYLTWILRGSVNEPGHFENPSYRREDIIKIDRNEIMEASGRRQYKGI
jgi:hypothetical protein